MSALEIWSWDSCVACVLVFPSGMNGLSKKLEQFVYRYALLETKETVEDKFVSSTHLVCEVTSN